MQLVGFWRRNATDIDGEHEDPHSLVSPSGSEAIPSLRAIVHAYTARCGMLESYEQAYSFCRFNGCTSPRRELGCATFTDGVYVWPEGFSHYLDVHGVWPPSAFVDHVLGQVESLTGITVRGELATDAARHAAAAALPLRHHLMWDESSRDGLPVPRGTAEYLRRVSTLQLQLPEQPSAKFEDMPASGCYVHVVIL